MNQNAINKATNPQRSREKPKNEQLKMLTNVDISGYIGLLNCAGFSVVFPQQAARHQICTILAPLVQNLYKSCTVWRDNTKSAQDAHTKSRQIHDKITTKNRRLIATTEMVEQVNIAERDAFLQGYETALNIMKR